MVQVKTSYRFFSPKPFHHFAPTKNAPPRQHGIDARKKRAQNPLVSAKIGTICTYATLPKGSGTVSAHLRRQHKPTVVRCKLEGGMGRAVGKTDCESARGPDADRRDQCIHNSQDEGVMVRRLATR
jgi:hypothetical protein